MFVAFFTIVGSITLTMVVHWILIKKIEMSGESVRIYYHLFRLQVVAIVAFTASIVIFFSGVQIPFFGSLYILSAVVWFGAYVALSLKACLRFWRASRLADAAASDSADQDADKVAVARAIRVQFYAAFLAVGTAWVYVISISAPPLVWTTSVYPTDSWFYTYFFNISAAFLDSVCNDFCTHILCFEVNTSSLKAAGRLIAEQTERAKDELAQHDVAARKR